MCLYFVVYLPQCSKSSLSLDKFSLLKPLGIGRSRESGYGQSSQSFQALPFQCLRPRMVSAIPAKTSIRLLSQDTAAGADVSIPPRNSQSCQLLPSNHLCHSAFSPPLTNTSSLPEPHDETAGADVSTPPSDGSHSCLQLHQTPSALIHCSYPVQIHQFYYDPKIQLLVLKSIFHQEISNRASSYH